MKNSKSVVGIILLLVLSAVFAYSGISKFISIEPFEWSFMDMGMSTKLAYFFARFFVGFELVLSAFLLFHFYLKKIVYPTTIFFLIVMTIYLAMIWITKGNDVDCGCFGDDLPMTPFQSILKNLGLLLITFILVKIYPFNGWKWQTWFALPTAIILWTLPFVLVPFTQQASKLDLDFLYNSEKYSTEIELRKDKHLVGFLSLGCPHCRKAAKVFSEILEEDPSLPIFMVILGNSTDTSDFFTSTNARNVPFVFTEDTESFKLIAGKYVPQIIWINNGIRERRLNYTQINKNLIKGWAH